MKQLYDLLKRVLQVDPQEINDDTSPKTVASWDSFNALILASELETEFKVKFTMSEISGVQCVGDIKRALRHHGVKLDE